MLQDQEAASKKSVEATGLKEVFNPLVLGASPKRKRGGFNSGLIWKFGALNSDHQLKRRCEFEDTAQAKKQLKVVAQNKRSKAQSENFRAALEQAVPLAQSIVDAFPAGNERLKQLKKKQLNTLFFFEHRKNGLSMNLNDLRTEVKKMKLIQMALRGPTETPAAPTAEGSMPPLTVAVAV